MPEDDLEVVATFGPEPAKYRGTWFEVEGGEKKVEAIRAWIRLAPDGKEIVQRVKTEGEGTIESLEEETKRMAAPLLYDLTDLQRHAHRLYGLSAQRTLEFAQSPYETRKADQLSANRQQVPIDRGGSDARKHRPEDRAATSGPRRPLGAARRCSEDASSMIRR